MTMKEYYNIQPIDLPNNQLVHHHYQNNLHHRNHHIHLHLNNGYTQYNFLLGSREGEVFNDVTIFSNRDENKQQMPLWRIALEKKA